MRIFWSVSLQLCLSNKKCKKVIAWSRDFGMDQYVSWCLFAEELNLDTIWTKYEFCKPQVNEVRACFDLLTSFIQGTHECRWVVQCGASTNQPGRIPPETAKILHKDIFWFFLHDQEFVSKTINDGNVALDKFPTSKVRQLVIRMESSKATVCHIKQVACNTQAAQINLLRHQNTELSAGKYKKKKASYKLKQSNHKKHSNENSQVPKKCKKWFDIKNAHQNKDRCSKCGYSSHAEGFQWPAKKYQCKDCHRFGHFTSLCYQKKQASYKSRKPKGTNYKAGAIYVKESAKCGQSEDYSSSHESFCLQMKSAAHTS